LVIHSQYQLMGGWALVFLPPVYLVYHSYRVYTERINLYAEKLQQDNSHIRELSELSQALISSLVGSSSGASAPRNQRAQRFAVALAQAAGLGEPEQEVLATAALVHDLGRLNLPGYLHSQALRPTAALLERMVAQELPGGRSIPSSASSAVEVVLAQNERWDGSGHPLGLQGEQIPVGGRILAIVGMFDLLTSRRDYRDAMSAENALHLLREGAGKQFDPELVARFEEVVEQLGHQVEPVAVHADENGNGRSAPGLTPAPSAA
jgi:putative two-component system response regulator